MTPKKKPLLLYLFLLVFLLSMSTIALGAPVGDSGGTAPVQSSSVVKTPFTDVAANDPNLIFITYLSQRGLMKGFPDGGFHPEEGLTRAEAASLFARIAGLKADSSPSGFKDVAKDHWAASSIAAAVKAGYIMGFPDGSFQPERKLSRAEGISLFFRLTKEKPDADLPSLQDINNQHWAAKSVAVALEAGMISLSKDGKKFYPDQSFKRGDLARTLSILLTKEPQLSRSSLYITLKVKSGEVKITRVGGKEENISGNSTLAVGDSISTGSGEAELSFPDGSGLLLKSGTKLAIKENQGRSYITTDGTPGTGIDFLEVELKEGKMFGALASKSSAETSQPAAETKKTSTLIKNLSKVASLKNLEPLLFAAADSAQPWYKTAEKKKVRVKVDMPWGVAAIRGSFWSNLVTDKGNSTSLLEGEAEVTSGGQTQSLGQLQSTTVTAANAPPSAPTQMTAAQSKEWVEVKTWVEAKAQEIVSKQEAAPPPPASVDAPPAPSQPTTAPQSAAPSVPNVINAVSSALSQAASTASGSASTPASNNNTGSGGSSNSSVNYTGTIGTWTVTDVISTVYNGTTYKLASDFAVNKPSNIVGNYYCLEIMNNSNFNVGVLEWKPVTEKMRRPTLFFSDPARIRVLFAKSYSGCDITGVYRLNTDGTLCDEMKTIQGIITLASPYKAPAGGLRVGIEAHGISGVDQIYVFTNEVTIPEGACSISYSLKVPGTLPNNSGYCVSFWPLGTYSEPWMESAPVNISCADIATAPINGEIPRGVWVNGSVQLPAPVPNGQTLGVTIKFEYQDPNEHPVFTCSGVINGNISSFNYTRPVKPGDYKVSYILYSTTDLLDYFAANRLLECAYYRINGPCTPFDGDIITIGSTSQEINLNVLNNGLLISGSAILPWQAHEDTDVYISSPSLPHYQGFAKIPAGSLSTNYTLVVPSGTVGTIYFFVGDVNGELTILSPLTADLPGQNVYLSTSSMASSSGKTHFNVPGPIEPNSILIGSTVFNLDSPDYTLDNLLIALTQLDSYYYKNGLLPNLGLYYKSPLPAWFDLNNPAIGNGSGLNDPANAIDPANLPELFGGIYPSSSMLGIHSSVLHYYVPQGFTGSIYLPFSPPTVNIAVSVGSTSSPVVLTDRGPVIYPHPMIRFDVDANHPGLGTNSLAYTLENSSYSPSAVTTTIQVTSLPGLEIVDSSTPPKHCLEEGYAAATMTITGAATGPATWNAGDPLTLVLSSGLGNKPVPQYSIDQSTVSVVYNQVSFTLPAGLPAEGFYCVELFRTGDSEPFALAPFPVCPAGNNSMINPGAVYNKANNILTIPVSGYEPYASLNPNKLTITSNGNSYTLGGTYMGVPDYASLSPGYFKYCPANNSFQVYLTGVDVSNMNSLASGPATLTAAYGWCIDAANNYAAATTGGINMVIVGP